ncbi:MAG: hypothetical protein JSU82_06430 [Rhodospirillales bacterium]|nr:MAG: hypothetical protein JSU82_06430 [Rhodospirillales bacterium]
MSSSLCTLVMKLAVVVTADAQEAEADLRWAVTGWAHWGTNGDITTVPGVTSDFENSWIIGGSAARQFARTGEDFVWEVEAGLYKHFGWQTHWEGDLSVGLRWDGYSWPKSLDSSAAIATGISYASSLPVLEEAVDPETRRWLQFMAVEIDFARPERPEWALVFRLHHRSAAWSLWGTDDGGSNFYGLGLRRWY